MQCANRLTDDEMMDDEAGPHPEPSPIKVASERRAVVRVQSRLAGFGSMSSIQRGVVGVVVGAFLILWPNVALSLAVAVVGAAVGVLGLVSGARAVRRRRPAALGRSLVDIAVGLALVVVSSVAADLIALALGIGLVVRGLVDAVVVFRLARSGDPWVWSALRAAAQVVTGLAVVVLGDGVVVLILLLIGATWLIGGLLTIAKLVSPDREVPVGAEALGAGQGGGVADVDSTSRHVVSWFQQQDVGPEARQDIVDKLIFEGEDFTRRVARYGALMTFATAIAALGIQTDSTAVVIGAMLVAPLMTPIMATSLSLVLGLPKRAARSLGLVAGGVAIAVGFSFLIARYAPSVVEIGANSQIASRTAPTLLDLLIALAAGFAGGYAVCRPDVSDSLPGVAIAVALVPPLAVVGITLAGGELVLASGAFLLFLTNLVGIIVASGLMFGTTGVAPWVQLAQNADQLRRTSLTVLVALVLISIPLAITGQRILADATNQEAASDATQDWLDEVLGRAEDEPRLGGGLAALEVVQVNLDGDVVEVVLIGDQEVEDADSLAERLTETLGTPIALELRIIPETRISIEPGTG